MPSSATASLFEPGNRDEELIQDPLVTLEGTWGQLVTARFSPSGRELIARYAGGKLVAWSTERWLPRHRLLLQYEAKYRSGQVQGLGDLEFAQDGSVIATKQGGRWRGWNTASGAEISERPKDMAPLTRAARIGSDGRSLRLAGQQVLLQTPKAGSAPAAGAQRRRHVGFIQPDWRPRGIDERCGDGEWRHSAGRQQGAVVGCRNRRLAPGLGIGRSSRRGVLCRA